MIDHPLWLLVEESTARVNIDLMVVNQSSIAPLVVFPCGVEEKS